jgi:YD repeat-containing protein
MYDAVGNQYGFENANGWFSSTLFDPLNRVWVEFTPEPIAFTSYTRTHTYDADGREIQVRDPNSGIVTTMYSARNEVATLVHT